MLNSFSCSKTIHLPPSPTFTRTAEGTTATAAGASFVFPPAAAASAAVAVLANRMEAPSDGRGSVPPMPPLRCPSIAAAAPEAGMRGKRAEARGTVDGIGVAKAAISSDAAAVRLPPARSAAVAPLSDGRVMQADEMLSDPQTPNRRSIARGGRRRSAARESMRSHASAKELWGRRHMYIRRRV